MQTIFKHKGIIIGAAVLVVVFVGYLLFRGSRSENATPRGGVTRQAVSGAAAASGVPDGPGEAFVSQLLAIQNIKLNLELFNDPVFKGLQNFSHEIAPQPISRLNPFAPIDLGELTGSTAKTSAAATTSSSTASSSAAKSASGTKKTKASSKVSGSSSETQTSSGIFQAVP